MEIENYKKIINETIKKHIKKYNSMPGSKEWDEKGYKPSRRSLEKKFNMSYNKILSSLGYTCKNKSPIRNTTDEELLDILILKAQLKGAAPTYNEVKSDPLVPNPQIYFKHFGSFNNALRLAGLYVNINRDKDALLKELIQLLKVLE